MKNVFLILSCLLVLSISKGQTNPHNYSVGTNITDVSSYGAQIMFKDLMKHAQEWTMLNPSTYQQIRNPDGSLMYIPQNYLRTQDGYPLQCPFSFSSQQVIAQANILDGGPHPVQTGEYEVSFSGTGQISIAGQGVSLGTGETSLNSSSPSDKIRFQYNDMNGDGYITVYIFSSASADPVRNIHIIPVQYLSDYQTQPFLPRFIDFLQPFTVIRFMDYMRTNNSPLVNFSSRCPVDYYTYTTDKGAPYELMIQLCNQTQKDCWACIPHMASDSFISSMATLLYNNLGSNRKIFIEYSNETWNPIFSAYQYMIQQGTALFGNYSSTTSLGDVSPNGRGLQFFAKRNCDVYRLFSNVFGSQMSARVCRVIGAQAANSYTSSYPLRIMQTGDFLTNNQKPDVIAIAPYLAADYYNVVPPNTSLSESVILDSLQGQINSFLIPVTRSHKQVANDFQIDLITYEGGQHLIPSLANVTKFYNVMKNPRMKTIYCNMLNAWKQESGGLFMHFSSISKTDIFGCWGAVESMDEVYGQQPKYQALVECGTPVISPGGCNVSATVSAPSGTDLCTGNKTLQLTTVPDTCTGCIIQWLKDSTVVPSLGSGKSATINEPGLYSAKVVFPCTDSSTKTILSNQVEFKYNILLELRLEKDVPQALATPNNLQYLVTNPDFLIPQSGTKERVLIINNGTGIPKYNGAQITDQANTDGTNNYFESGYIIHARKAGQYTLQSNSGTCGSVNTKPITLTLDTGTACLAAPAAPASLSITAVSINTCGNKIYRYSAPNLSSATTTVSGATGWSWSFTGTLGANAAIDSGTINSQTIRVKFTNNAAAVTGDSVRVAYTYQCGTSSNRTAKLTNTILGPPAAPASISYALVNNVCGNRIYRYTAPALPAATSTSMAGTGYIWSFTGTLGANATVDSGSLSARVVRIKFTNNAAAATGDSIRLVFTSDCGNSAAKAIKLPNTLLTAPAAPLSITITTVTGNVCGARIYRYAAPALTAGTSTTTAATGWLWAFTGTLGSNATLDSGTLTSRVVRMKFTSNAAAVTGDSVKVSYTSDCGSSPWKAAKLTNTLLSPPAAPSYITITKVSDTCGSRIFRYTAPPLPSATSTNGAGTGWQWSFVGTLGSNAVVDSGTLNSRVIRMKFTSNAAAAKPDSARVLFTSNCGNSPRKAVKLTNTALNCPLLRDPVFLYVRSGKSASGEFLIKKQD